MEHWDVVVCGAAGRYYLHFLVHCHMLHTPSEFNEIVYIGIGSNLGNRAANVQSAVQLLQSTPHIQFEKCSSIVETAPWGGVAQQNFLNCAVAVRTDYSPYGLLQFVKNGETTLGRISSERWGPRIIDLDILLFGQRIISTEELTIPHAQLEHRAFVLNPLLELEPSLRHPVSGRALLHFLEVLTD